MHFCKITVAAFFLRRGPKGYRTTCPIYCLSLEELVNRGANCTTDTSDRLKAAIVELGGIQSLLVAGDLDPTYSYRLSRCSKPNQEYGMGGLSI